MNQLDLAFVPALEQAQLIRKGDVSPLELVELYLERIQRLDPQFNSYVTVAAEQALAEAAVKTEQLTKTADVTQLPPFFGVPIPIKDLNAVAGLPCGYGSPALKDQIASYDDGVVTRIKQAGFTILGKTATSELGALPYIEPEDAQPTRNPWNLDRTAGGSSGGAAAALAAGLCPIAQGSDGGGSIRGPAFCCGLIGLKPSRGRISQAPAGDNFNGMATSGPLTRTVADAAALLDAMSGYLPGDLSWLPDPDPSFLTVARQATMAAGSPARQPLKIAFATAIPDISEAEPVCEQAVLQMAQLLAEMGHQVEPGCPNFAGLDEPFIQVWQTAVAASGIPAAALDSMNRWLLSRTCSAGEYVRATAALQVAARQIVAFFQQVDVLVLPTYMAPPIPVGKWASCSPEETLRRMIEWIAPCPPFNVSGQPAIAIPTGFTEAGLPIGVQLIGRPAAEATLIKLAAQIEATQSWTALRPPLAISG